MPPAEDTAVELCLEHTFDPPADASAIKRALIFRSYSYAVEARDASFGIGSARGRRGSRAIARGGV